MRTPTLLEPNDDPLRDEPAASPLALAGSRPTAPQTCSFLQEGGALGEMMRAHDWSTSSLGDPVNWPRALQTTVGLLLNSKFPMFVAWGPELALFYNDAYAPILEDKHPSALGFPFPQVWADVWADVEPIAARALSGQLEYYADLPLTLTRKGVSEEAWFTFSYSPARDDAGQIAGLFCACTETTQEVLGRRDQQAEYFRFRALFQKAPGLVAILREPNHIFEFANDAYMHLVGQRVLTGKPLCEALPEAAAQGFVDLLDNTYQSGELHIGRGVAINLQRSADSPMEERFVDFFYQPIRDAHGQITGVFVEGSDVTERVLSEKALREGERRKDEFLSMLAHELRNPLAPISTAAEILKLDGATAEVVKRAGDVIGRQVAHMKELLDDLLDVSRVTRGLVTIGNDHVDLVSVLDDAVEQTQSAIREKRLHFSVRVSPGPLYVCGDRTRLIQVFSNILQNAAKYTPANGHICLSLETEGKQLRVAVTDDGVGIPPDLLLHLFELFTQAHQTSDRSQGGLGLGLSLVKSLVELHKGTVFARSAGLGKGSEFVVLIPRVKAPGHQSSVAAHPASAPGKFRIMVVDDNVDAAETLGELLRSMGHQVSLAYTGTAALELVTESAPELVFLDIGLPDMDGYELVRRMRQQPVMSASMAVALTGYGQAGDQERALEAGFDRHITKPMSFECLSKVLADCAVKTGSA